MRRFLALSVLIAAPLVGVSAYMVYSASLDDARAPGTGGWRVLHYLQERGELHYDLSISAAPISLAGRRFERGLGTHANSEIRIFWEDERSTLTGFCGVDDAARGQGSIVCKVLSDRRQLFTSPVLRGGETPVSFSVPVDGLTQVDLIIEDADDGTNGDFGSWAGLELR